MSRLYVRPAAKSDAPFILEMVCFLARYEKAEDQVLATVKDVENTLFCDHPKVEALICEKEGTPIGFAVYFFNYSTWQGRHGLYLEDLFVLPEHRQCGAGKLMFKHLAAIALEKNCGRFEWSVLDWNTPAIEFYKSLSAEPQDEWIRYRLSGDGIRKLAEGCAK